eukprot:COSAG02_NODE_18018_length_965_cov_1.599307_1_plen_44_part_10
MPQWLATSGRVRTRRKVIEIYPDALATLLPPALGKQCRPELVPV